MSAFKAPRILEDISKRTKQQAHMLLRLVVWAMEDFKPPRPDFASDVPVLELMREKYSFLKSSHDLDLFLDYTLKYLLYQPEELILKPRQQVETDQVFISRECSSDCKRLYKTW